MLLIMQVVTPQKCGDVYLYDLPASRGSPAPPSRHDSPLNSTNNEHSHNTGTYYSQTKHAVCNWMVVVMKPSAKVYSLIEILVYFAKKTAVEFLASLSVNVKFLIKITDVQFLLFYTFFDSFKYNFEIYFSHL